MKSVEAAYKIIASALLDSASCKWQQIVFQAAVLSRNCSGMQTLIVDVSGKSVSTGLGMHGAFLVNDAAIFLRDDLLRSTGQRIWGLTFTLFPDGKFNIEYDYNKPEGYEETDEVITGNEISQSLAGLDKSG